MTNSVLVEKPVAGQQRPRISHVPKAHKSLQGADAVELARMAGLDLDPWQEYVLANSLGERADGKWAAFEVGLVVSRQNGKGTILEARELAGLFLLGERLIVHSAHQFDTSLEAFRRLRDLIEGCPDFSRWLKSGNKSFKNSHGEEGIELTTGQRIRFRTRTKGGGRGFTGDCLILDEAMILPESAHGALLPTLSARPNPQVWYAGSAVDWLEHEHGTVLGRVRDRALRGDDDRLAYFEWSVDADLADAPEYAEDAEAWAAANPGLGIRISAEHVAAEQRSMEPRKFAVERLGIGYWPRVDGLVAGIVIDAQQWAGLTDANSSMAAKPCLAFDVSPDRSTASIAAVALREDGLTHVELIESRSGVGRLPERMVEIMATHSPTAVLCDLASPAASLVPALRNLGVNVETVNAREYAQACGLFFDGVEDAQLRHLGQSEIDTAVRGAARRTLGDAWAWSRRSSSSDITPLVACTLALWGLTSKRKTPTPRFEVLV